MISGVVNSYASVTIIRILSRVLQFVLRVYLIREVLSPQILAEMVALDLIMTTSLHIAKNCFKPSYQQVQSKNKQQNIVSSMNLMTLGILVTFISSLIVIYFQWNHKIQVQYVNESILLYGLCSIFEALKQKYSVQFVLNYQYKKIALIELVSYLPKTILLFVAAKGGLFQKYGILVFGIGQTIYYSMCFLITFCLTNYRPIFIKAFSLQHSQANKDQKKKQQHYFDMKTKKILKQLSYLSVFKLFLQQFQKIVLVVRNTVQISSVYSLVSNLGSIVVRFVFAPLEQIAYNYYARGTEQQSKMTLIHLVKVIAIFSCLCIGFGFRYAEDVLLILYGQKWVNNDSVFALQCYLVLLSVLGINGSIEAFVMARGDLIKTIPKFKYFTLLSTSVYIGCSFILLHLGFGSAGLFLANALNFLIRMIISWNIQIKHHIPLSQFLYQILPKKQFVVVLLICLTISHKLTPHWIVSSKYADLAVGIILFGISLLPMLYQYRNIIISHLSKNKENKTIRIGPKNEERKADHHTGKNQ